MQKIVELERLRVSRNARFNLRIPKLQLYTGNTMCVVGPNGSGKTTLIECVAGLLTPDAGKILVGDLPVTGNVRTLKAMVGFIPDDEDWFIKELCAREYFSLLKGVYRQAGCTTDMQARVMELAATLQFEAFEVQLQHLSHGNKKKVQIIAALMHRPRLLVVDEIRNGLDPMSIIAIESLLKQEVRRGMGLIAATHDLWWAERIADDVLLVIEGSVAAYGKKTTLLKRYGNLETLFVTTLQKTGKVHAL